MTEKEYKSLNRLIMYDTIPRLHKEEHRSIKRKIYFFRQMWVENMKIHFIG